MLQQCGGLTLSASKQSDEEEDGVVGHKALPIDREESTTVSQTHIPQQHRQTRQHTRRLRRPTAAGGSGVEGPSSTTATSSPSSSSPFGFVFAAVESFESDDAAR